MCLAYLGFFAFFHSLFPFIEFSPRVMTCFQIFLVYEWEGCQPCFNFVWLFGLNAFLSDIGLVSWRETENPLENEMGRIGGFGTFAISLFLSFSSV